MFWGRGRIPRRPLAGMLVVAACMGSAGSDPASRRRAARQAHRAPATTPTPQVATAPSHGFGEEIAWRHLDEGMAEANASGRPLMLVVHASWCGQCKRLKPAFVDKELTELAQHFVMVNADQDEAPQVLKYAPDGAYLPRVLFFAPQSAEVDASLSNERRGKQRYYYGPTDDLVGTMRKALKLHGKS